MGIPLAASIAVVGTLVVLLLLGRRAYTRLQQELVTQTKLLQDALASERHARERYGEVFANASDVILPTNLDGRLVAVNRAAEVLAHADGGGPQIQVLAAVFKPGASGAVS